MRAGNAGIDTVIAGAGRQNLDANVVGWAAPHTSWAYDRGPQCVPFARALSSISLFGDAWHWWSAAAGRYDRGFKPQAGSVLSFRPDARMPLGHVAVVTRVISAREIEVDHANWALPGAITRKAQVLDVSTDNDWTAVRVGLRERDHFGAVYTTNGFIYGRPIELGPQIVDVAEVLRNRRERQAVSNSPENSGLPIVVEGGRIRSAQPAVFSQSDPGWPIVMRLGRS
jgi:hypothetical protein